jgi:molybdopterin molybdotransferase
MITVEEAEKIILNESFDYGTEMVPLVKSLGRILAEVLFSDRDLPPFNRATVDGIAINIEAYHSGNRNFLIKGTQAAGDNPISVTDKNSCIEIMTGAAIHECFNTVIRYEDLSIENSCATINQGTFKPYQNIHLRGKDKLQGEILVEKNKVINPAIIGISASIGKTNLLVRKLPRVLVVSTGDELVRIDETPKPYQIRQSNGLTILATLQKYKIRAHKIHLKDDKKNIELTLKKSFEEYDVILLTGGVSMGKYDFIPDVLQRLGVKKLFHKVKQRPGKPFWFGKKAKNKFVFAFPGNPVSVFMCLHRYFVPWLRKSMGLKETKEYAILGNDFEFPIELQLFAQVELQTNEDGQTIASYHNTNGSGDFSHLAETNAFIELPANQNTFKKGEAFRIWRYN